MDCKHLYEAAGRVHAPAPLAAVAIAAQYLEQATVLVYTDRGLAAAGEAVIRREELVRPEPAAQVGDAAVEVCRTGEATPARKVDAGA